MFKKSILIASVCLWIASCRIVTEPVSDRVCLLTMSAEQLVKDGKTTLLNQQTIAFNAYGQPITYQGRTPGQLVDFAFEYRGTFISRAYLPSQRSTQVLFSYDGTDRLTKAVYSLSGNERAVYAITYENGQPATLVETRKNGITTQVRSFEFRYDDDGNLVGQTLVTGSNGTQTQEDWTFTLENTPRRSPYADVPQPVLLAVMALTNPDEQQPARFLQRTGVRAYQRSRFSNTARTALETVTFQTDYDPLHNPVRRTASLTTGQLLQTFQYNCAE